MTSFDVSGRRVLITGSSKGIGEGIASHLSSQGCMVVLHGRDLGRLEAVRRGIADRGGSVAVVSGDLRREAEAQAAIDEAAHAFDGLDGLVNNAGGSFVADATAISANGFNAVLQTNLTSSFLTCRAAFPHLVADSGSIVNISSIAALRPSPSLVPYAAAKAGVNQMTQSLAAEWAGTGVRVNAILPGVIATEAALANNFDNDPERIAAAEARVGVGRLGQAEDVALAVQYLLSEASGFVNGTLLVVDGGPPGDYAV